MKWLISYKWLYYSTEDDNQESQEVVQDHLTRQLTKEYLDLLGKESQDINL